MIIIEVKTSVSVKFANDSYNRFDVQGHTPLRVFWSQTYYTTGRLLCVILFQKLVNWCSSN